ncbi:Hypothetical predicted protein [Podarcis lilfordi]|uniref:Uncharacterized protein n=1 Tax=Podarcis lilfordi TaxID=74358 RepID=A0AA35P7M3_9SAUR|nr:Hypothetical predicted protein [Podarcis lilfordi]
MQRLSCTGLDHQERVQAARLRVAVALRASSRVPSWGLLTSRASTRNSVTVSSFARHVATSRRNRISSPIRFWWIILSALVTSWLRGPSRRGQPVTP